MIKEIFLPAKLGARRLFAQRIAGVYQYERSVFVAIAYVKPAGVVIEQLHEEPITQTPDEANSHEEATIAALRRIRPLLDRANKVIVAVPAHLTIAKELELPFIDPEKIRMVLDYEIESMLPFPIDDAVIDFMVTKIADDRSSSQIMAVAMRKQDLAAVIDLYQAADIRPVQMGIDLFASYSLYEQIPDYKNNMGTALVDISLQGTRITFLQQNQIKLTRYIARGIQHLLPLISEEGLIDVAEAERRLFTHGLRHSEDEMFDKVVRKHFIDLFNEIQFTLNSFSLKLGFYGEMRVLFLGKVTQLPDIAQFGSDLLQMPCELFDPKKLLANKSMHTVKAVNSHDWHLFAVPLGLALPIRDLEEFNLRRKEFSLVDESLAIKQIVTALSLILIMFASIGGIGYWQIGRLSNQARSLEQEQIAKILQVIPKKDRARNAKLAVLTRKAETILKDKTALWAPFGQERIKPLAYLYEVTYLLGQRFIIELDELQLGEKSGKPLIELEGFFKSERGLGYHHTDFTQVEDRIKESTILEFVEPPVANSAVDKGIKFSIKLTKRAEVKNNEI